MTMNKQLVARGIAGALSLCGVLGLVGCGAESGAPEAEIGSSEQAIARASLASGYSAIDSAFLKIGTNDAMIAGGNNAGTIVNTIKKASCSGSCNSFPANFTFANIGSPAIALNTKRAEFSIAPVPSQANKYYAVGGIDDTSTIKNTLEIIDTSAPSVTAVTQTLSVARKKPQLVPCGNHLLAIGGETPTASNALDVIEFNSGTPLVHTMKNKDNGTTVVTLGTARKGFGAVALSSTVIYVFGGTDANGNALSTGELLTVNSSCQLDDLDAGTIRTTPPAGASLPSALENFAASLTTQSLTIGGNSVQHEVIAAGGDDGSAAVLDTYWYDHNTTTWHSAGDTPNISAAHVAPMFAPAVVSGAGDFALVGGFDGLLGVGVATDVVDQLSGTTFSSATMTDPRALGWAAFLNNQYFAGMGKDDTNALLTANE